MLIKFFIPIIVSLLLFVSCNKITDSDKVEITKDTLVQYFEYTLNDSEVKFVEDDLVTFNPDKGTTVYSNDSINFLYFSDIFITVEHRSTNSSFYDNYEIGFRVRLNLNQMDWKHKINDHIAPILKPGVFESLFLPGNMNYTVQGCEDSITNINSVAINFPFYGSNDKSYYTEYPGCLSEGEENYYKQNTSFFQIDIAEKYHHKKFGDCIILSGVFQVILYNAPNSAWEEKLILKNGRFKILVTDNNWRYPIE
jgi:hypothetical protein